MALALCALSHSPLFSRVEPAGNVRAQLDEELDKLRAFVAEFSPELTVVFGPDHFNGVFYDLMPQFTIAAQATAVGDWGTRAGQLNVDASAARRLGRAVLAAGVDVAHSERLTVDHGVVQPLELLFGIADVPPIVPVIVNAVGLPLGPMQRVRLLGEAIGRELSTWNRRVLLVSSGGLSHDPPVPRFEGAAPDVAERLIWGRNPSREARELRQQRVIEAARAHALGDTTHRPLNSEFDKRVLNVLESGRLSEMDSWSNGWVTQEGGNSGHEIRTWLAAFSALSTAGTYKLSNRAYWPVTEWMTGFALASAATA